MNRTDCQALRESPLFQLSLASRELFHSNFLAWLLDRHPTWVGPIFGTQSSHERWALGPKGSRREEHSLDLVLHLADGSTLIVENKVKSVPYSEQLDRYESLVGGLQESYPQPRFLLLTLAAGDAPGSSRWPVLTYDIVGERLMRAASDLAEGYERSLIEDYAGFIRTLSAFAEIQDDDRWIENDIGLRELRISDLLQKRRATWLSRGLATALKSEFGDGLALVSKKSAELDVGELLIYDGLTNGNGLVGFVLVLTDGPKLEGARGLPRIGVGVQIQGGQYRSFIEMLRPTQPSKDTIEAFRELALKLFDHSPLPAWWSPADRGVSSKDLCTYGGKFFYRYRALPPTLSGEDATLASLSQSLLQSARTLIGGAETIRTALGHA